jgi:hypothetical protein
MGVALYREHFGGQYILNAGLLRLSQGNAHIARKNSQPHGCPCRQSWVAKPKSTAFKLGLGQSPGEVALVDVGLHQGARLFAQVGTPSSTAIFTLTNNNSTSITMTATCSGVAVCSNNSDFAVSSTTCTGTIAAGGTCTASVVYTPSTAGAATATLSFNDSDGSSPQTAALTGTGVAILPNGGNLEGVQ